MSLKLKDLTIKNRRPDFFKSINFTFEYGKIYFCHGAHGIGKSSLVNSLVGLSTPLEGEIVYEDVNFYNVTVEMKDTRFGKIWELSLINQVFFPI